jgi:hypothetical protein
MFWLGLTALAAAAFAAGTLRKRFVSTWFFDGPAGARPTLAQAGRTRSGLMGPDGVGVAAADRVRVFLLDGLSATAAADLPVLSQLCAAGNDLVIDVGYPTVSLPVQASLWTAETQQQLGLLYRIKPLGSPPPAAAPARVPGSVAVAEDQPFIAGSFGFAELQPPAPLLTSGGWSAEVFVRAAKVAVAGPARLAFVHVLRIDKAGHKEGSRAPAYRAAALWADGLLAELLALAPAASDTRWFVLADHGHRASGGHAGAEAEVRLVRGCIVGAGIAAGVRGRVHLVDVARALQESLGLSLPAAAAGRPLGFALAHPDPDAVAAVTGAGRGPVTILIAVALLAALALATRRLWRGDRRVVVVALAWVPLAYAGVYVANGPLTLSSPIIYPPVGRDIMIAGTAGLLILWALVFVVGRRDPVRGLKAGVVALAPALVAALVSLVACGGLATLVDHGRGPPLVEPVTAHASVFLALLAAGGAGVALAAAITAAWSYLRSRRAAHSAL